MSGTSTEKPSLEIIEEKGRWGDKKQSTSVYGDETNKKDGQDGGLEQTTADDADSASSSQVGDVEVGSRAHSILSHAIERLSTHASSTPMEPPPDGGLKAWTIGTLMAIKRLARELF